MCFPFVSCGLGLQHFSIGERTLFSQNDECSWLMMGVCYRSQVDHFRCPSVGVPFAFRISRSLNAHDSSFSLCRLQMKEPILCAVRENKLKLRVELFPKRAPTKFGIPAYPAVLEPPRLANRGKEGKWKPRKRNGPRNEDGASRIIPTNQPRGPPQPSNELSAVRNQTDYGRKPGA